MHNLALDLSDLGHIVTGSDDEIYEPSRSRLKAKGLLPDQMGWDRSRITSDLDAVILGKHAHKDNPELEAALDLGLPVYSFPEFIAMQSNARHRICIAGSHGKTSTTAMVMHVLKHEGLDFDYLVGAQLEGFNKMVRMSGSDILVVEGDEYASSALDNRAKMLHYKANIAVITGMAWDHVNIYPSYESYKNAFRDFLNSMPETAVCFFDQNDQELNEMMLMESFPLTRKSYNALPLNKKSQVEFEGETYPVEIFGQHNMLNLNAARYVCQELGIDAGRFFEAIKEFKGAAKRLEKIYENGVTVYRDFAHAPSKCLATVNAVRSRYPDRKIRAVLELHTYSSLNIEFISNYRGSIDAADEAIVFYDNHALEIKRMAALDKNQVSQAFDHDSLAVTSDPGSLESWIRESLNGEAEVLLIMSSGALGGVNVGQIISELKTTNAQ